MEWSIYKVKGGAGNYARAPGGSHLMDTWHACNLLEVVPCSHARLDCRVVVPASPVFRQMRYSIKTDSIFVSVSSIDKDSEKTMDSFSRMHMIWIDRI